MEFEFLPSINDEGSSEKRIPSKKTAEDRSQRIAFATGGDPEGIKQELLLGNEDLLRQQAVTQENNSNLSVRRQVTSDLVKDAVRAGRPLTREEEFAVLNSPMPDNANPQSVLESQWAEKFLTTVVSSEKENIVTQGLLDDNTEEFTQAQLDIAGGMIAKADVNRGFREKIADVKAENGYIEHAGDIAASMLLPFRHSAAQAQVGGDGIFSSILAPGETVANLIKDIVGSVGTAEYKQKLGAVLDPLMESNPFVAESFIDRLEAVSNTQASSINAWNAAEAAVLLADLGGVGLARKGAGAMIKAFKTPVKTTTNTIARGQNVRSTNTTTTSPSSVTESIRTAAQHVAGSGSNSRFNPTPASVLNAMGDTQGAATARSLNYLERAFVDGAYEWNDITKQKEFVADNLPNMYQWDRRITSTQNFSAEAATRLTRLLTQETRDMLEGHASTLKVRRRTREVLEDLAEKARAKLRTKYDGTKASILDTTFFRTVDQGDTLENLGRVYTTIGDMDAKGWKKQEIARAYAKNVLRIPSGNFKIKQQGLRWFIETFQDLDESLDPRNLQTILTSPVTETPQGFANTFLGFLRSPADTLARFQTNQRDVATFASNESLRLMKDQAELVTQSMSSKQRKQWKRALEALKRHEDPITGEVGRFAKDTFEFERIFERANGGLSPTEGQIESYFRAIQINDFEHFVRNLQLRKDKARLGMEEVTISSPDGTLMKLEGKLVDDFPAENAADYGMVLWNNQDLADTPKYIRKSEAGWDTRKKNFEVSKKLGYKLIQIANPDQLPFKDKFGIDDTVEFMLIKDADLAPLSMKQLNYNPGFHKIYRDPWYVKQMIVHISNTTGRKFITGDKSIINASSEAEARAQVKMFNELRGHFNSNDKTSFDRVATFMGRDSQEMWNKFRRGAKDPTDKKGIDPYVPLSVTRAGSRTQEGADMADYIAQNNLGDIIDNPYNLYRNIQKKFTGERDPDLDSSFREGTENNPVFRNERPRLLDPLESINKGLTNVMRSGSMEDYKIQALDHYIAEFGNLLNSTPEELLQNPLNALHSPDWKHGVDAGRLAAAKNTRMAVRSLLGTPSPLQERINWTYDKLVSKVWERFGTDKAQKVSDSLVSITKDPFVYTRAFAFHTKLGLFNPVQLWLQAQTWSNLVGIAPKEVLPASAAAARMSALRFTNDPNIISRMATMGGKELGMSQKDFIESYTAMRRSGIFNVGGEVAWRDDMMDPKVVSNPFGRVLEKGTFFFKEGERFSRLSGWNVAYLQWKKANPGVKLTDDVIGELVSRTNDLTVNMIRSSTPAWQQGIFSVPTQFWSYQARLTELYLGGRLTTAEKLRMFTAHSMLYGVPVAAGAVTGVWPWYEDIRQGMLERGVDVDNPATMAMLQGIPATLLKGITGESYNVGQRYGPGGQAVLKEILDDEKSFLEVMGGASSSIFLDSVGAAAPVWTSMVKYMTGQEGPSLTASDFIKAFSTISSVNQASKAYYMVTMGKYMTKNGITMDSAGGVDAVMMAAFGLSQTDIGDTFLKINSMKNWEEMKKSGLKEYTRQIKLANRSEDDATRETYLKNARVIMESTELLPKERANWIRQAYRNVEAVEEVNKNFVERSPLFQQEQRQRELMMKNEREADREGVQ